MYFQYKCISSTYISSTFFLVFKKKVQRSINIMEYLRKKSVHFSAKFRISSQNFVKNMQKSAFPQNYEKFCNSLRFVYILLCGYSNSGHSLLV